MELRKRRYDRKSKSNGNFYYWFVVDGIKVGNALVVRKALFNFNILPKYRRCGYATKFMVAIMENNTRLKWLHANSCDLKNGLSTSELVKFYSKFGFTVVNTTHPFGVLMIRDCG